MPTEVELDEGDSPDSVCHRGKEEEGGRCAKLAEKDILCLTLA
jgi:hypothetical protein